MKCRRTPIEVEVVKYDLETKLEDGFEFFTDVIIKDNVNHDKLIQVERAGMIVCPYILTRRGKTFIKQGDYIIIEEDGTKVVCGEDKVFSRYEKIE